MYETDDPSPFDVAGSLSENWWLKSAWGVCTNMAKGVQDVLFYRGKLPVTIHLQEGTMTGSPQAGMKEKEWESAPIWYGEPLPCRRLTGQ